MLNHIEITTETNLCNHYRITGIKYMRLFKGIADPALGSIVDGQLGGITIVLKVKTGDS